MTEIVEPLTYAPEASASYFRDRALDARGDEGARGRLERHGREMGVEIPRRDAVARMTAAQKGLEFRVNPNTTDGQGGFLSPPLWLIDKFAGVPRAPRVLANLVPTFPLPRGVSSVNLPRLTTGDSVGINSRFVTPPVQSALATSTSGGTGLTAATAYFYVVTALTATGESRASNEQTVTTGAGTTNSNTVTWASSTGATGYRVYRGTAAGGEGTFYTVGAVATFTDTGAAGTAGTPPTSNTTTTPSDTDIADAAVSSPVVTIAGMGVVAMQLLEQSPPGAHLDWAIFKDLSQAYDEQLEIQMLYGTGAGGQFLGVTNVPGIASVTYTGGPTGGGMYTAWCQTVAQVGDARKAPPETTLVRTARWAWLAAQGDSQLRPLIPPGAETRRSIAGVPTEVDDAISATLGAGSNQDEMIACRPSDMILLEGTPRVKVNVDTGVSGTLQARLEFLNYAAFLAGRYPAGIGVTTGTGHIVQAGY